MQVLQTQILQAQVDQMERLDRPSEAHYRQYLSARLVAVGLGDPGIILMDAVSRLIGAMLAPEYVHKLRVAGLVQYAEANGFGRMLGRPMLNMHLIIHIYDNSVAFRRYCNGMSGIRLSQWSASDGWIIAIIIDAACILYAQVRA